jgi:hypothetical protein
VGETKTPNALLARTRKIARAIRRHISARAQAISLVVVSLAVVVAGVVLFSIYAVSPAQGIINAVKQSLASGQAGLDMRPRVVAGGYASFNCPRGLTAMPVQPFSAPTLASYNWKHPDIQTWRLAISIIEVPSLKITDNNAYLFRKSNPQRFSETLELINGQAVPVMTDMTAGGFSKVGFLRHGRYQAVVSLYGDDQHGLRQLQATLNMVLRSWHWRQT